jgi:endoglucanase
VFNQTGPAWNYPGVIEGKHWDKAALEAALRPVIDFQRNHRAHIYMGEFSAIRWAPDSSACRHLRDVIEIFEEHGWDWSYHAFREWDGWSVEHSDDRSQRAPLLQPSDRQRLLQGWFARNQKPKLQER